MIDVRTAKVVGWLVVGACLALVGCKSSSSSGTTGTGSSSTTTATGTGGASQGGAGQGGKGPHCGLGAQEKWDVCAACTEKFCAAEEKACCEADGCAEEINCAAEKGCSGFDWYKAGVCKELIDKYGGVAGPGANAALSFGSVCILKNCNSECTKGEASSGGGGAGGTSAGGAGGSSAGGAGGAGGGA